MKNYRVSAVDWRVAQTDSARIRTAVFMQEQQVSAADEWDGMDEQATHFLVRNDHNEAVATARILTETYNHAIRYHIGRVAVLKAFRGRGLGHSLMRAMITWCQTNNAGADIYLHAQVNRQTFYQKLGFVAHGTEFMDAGIAHISMCYRKEFDYEYPLPAQ